MAFYELVGLECTSRTEIPTAYEAMIENPTEGEAATRTTEGDRRPRMGTMWKLYVHTDDCVDCTTGGCRRPPRPWLR